jgi:uncharacterized protein YegP (UPF0339 family)
MNVKEIKQAINNGQVVTFSENYKVIKDSKGQYLIVCLSNNHTIGLTWIDGKTLNGPEELFCVSLRS